MILFTGVGLVPRGGSPNFLGSLKFFGGSPIFQGGCLQFFGVSKFSGGDSSKCSGGLQFFEGGRCPQFFGRGGSPNFRGGLQNFFSIVFFFFFQFFSRKFLLGCTNTPPPTKTVNARAVRILLECILVYVIVFLSIIRDVSHFFDTFSRINVSAQKRQLKMLKLNQGHTVLVEVGGSGEVGVAKNLGVGMAKFVGKVFLLVMW